MLRSSLNKCLLLNAANSRLCTIARHTRPYSFTAPWLTDSQHPPPLPFSASQDTQDAPSSFPQYDVPSTSTPSSLHLPYLSGNSLITPTLDPHHATRFEDRNEKLLDGSFDFDCDYLVPRPPTNTSILNNNPFQEVHAASTLGHTLSITTEMFAEAAPPQLLFKSDATTCNLLSFDYACAGHAYHFPSKETARETVVRTLPSDLFSAETAGLPVSVSNGVTTTVLKPLNTEASAPSPMSLLVKECTAVEAFDKLKVGGVTSLGCGEDSVVGSMQLLGLADGVSGWNDVDSGHASLWSRLILHRFLTHYVKVYNNQNSVNSPSAGSEISQAKMLQILDRAYIDTRCILGEHKETGSSTLILASLNQSKDSLQVLNIGDSSIYVIRDGKIVFTANRESCPENRCPKQLGTNSTKLPSAVASYYSIPVQQGDLILMCSDGVSDNLWESEITDALEETFYKDDDASHTTNSAKIQAAADLLVSRATDRSFNEFVACPYHVKSSHCPTGGKNDDISVLLAEVAEFP